jgi:putative glycosyltransferase (TIGR04372 family)
MNDLTEKKTIPKSEQMSPLVSLLALPKEFKLGESDQKFLKEGIRSCPPIQKQELSLELAYFHQGSFFALNEESFEKALSSYIKAIEVNPKFAEAHYCIGMLCMLVYRIFLAASNMTSDEIQKISLKSKVVDCIDSAFHHFQEAIAHRPNFPEALFRMGQVASDLKDSNAHIFWKKALELKPNYPEVYFEMSYFSFWCEKKIDEALHYFDKALELKPEWVEAYDVASYHIRSELDGSYHPKVKIHAEEGEKRRLQRSSELKLSTLPIRMLAGVIQSIGHCSFLDTFAKSKILGLLPDLQMMVLAPKEQIINPCLLGYWKKYFPIITDPLVVDHLQPLEKYLLGQYSDITGFSEKYCSNEYILMADIQLQWEEEKRPSLLELSEVDYERGWETLKKLGVSPGAWFVCLHARDQGFKGALSSETIRNVNILDYTKAINSIVERGGWVIRMGDPKMTPLPSLHHVIDYAHSDIKSDWMDVFLWSQCRFFIGCNSGPAWIPLCFGVPCVRTNSIALTRLPVSRGDLVIHKLFWSELEKRYLTFKEVVDPGGNVRWTHNMKVLSEKSIKPVDNTPEEINEVVLEMLDRVEGKIKYSEEDEALQKRFARVVKETCSPHKVNDKTSRMGRDYLKRYDALVK